MTTSSIRTPDQRIRVFVSSTLGDLGAERRAVRNAVERLHMVPVMFELGARPHAPGELYRAYLSQSHVFVGIYHRSYGWIAPGEKISGLEDEFRLSAGMPRLLYLKRPAEPVDARLEVMFEGLRSDATASYRVFSDAAELETLVEEDLAVLVTESFMDARDSPVTDPPAVAPPVPITPTVGRNRDIARITALLRDGVRLLTVIGPGGVGKSRLALEVVRTAAADFDDDVVFVPLEDIDEPRRVLPAIARRLGVTDSGTRPTLDALADELSARRVLLLIDNFEQVTAAAPDIAELLGRCPGVVALVTSRHALRVRGEREYHLPPLPVDGEENAQRLFVERAQAANPGFRLTPANRPHVDQIVRLLDGLPLAIELAAPQLRMLSPAALLDRLTERLDLLSGGAGDLPPRQRTLRLTLDWSYHLLNPSEQALFTRLSVFAGGATLEAVEVVTGDRQVPDVLATLSSLAEKSLIVDTDTGLPPRVRMLSTVRSRAAELLAERGETESMTTRHAHYYADLAEPGDVLRHRGATGQWPRFEAEVDNLRAAVTWAARHTDTDLLVDFGRRLWAWAWSSGRVGEMLKAVLAAQSVQTLEPGARGYLAYLESYARGLTGDFPGALAAAGTAVTTLGDADDDERDILVAAARLVRGTLRLARNVDAADGRGDLDAAVTTAREKDNAWLLGYATSHRGLARAMAGDLAGARADHLESLAAARAMEHDDLIAQAVGQLAVVDVLKGEPDSALEHLNHQVELLRHSRNLEGLANALDTAAGTAILRRRWETGLTAATAATALRRRIGIAAWPLIGDWHDATVAAAVNRVPNSATVVAHARERDPWTVIEEALTPSSRSTHSESTGLVEAE